MFAGVLCALVLAACGGDRTGGPQGDPTDIVSRAPDRTAAAGTATVAISLPSARASGVVDFGTGLASDLRATPAAVEALPAAARRPGLALDVVRAVASIEPYGGSEVRGASTIRYELDIAPTPELLEQLGGSLEGDTFYADVYIDSEFRIRRLSMPLDLNEGRPTRTNRILAKLIIIDFYDFGVSKSQN